MIRVLFAGLIWTVYCAQSVASDARLLKPYILGSTITGSIEQVVATVETRLSANGFSVIGSYSPYAGARVIVVTSPELLGAAGVARFGGFGAGQRVAVTQVKTVAQVSYVNPSYLAAAYGLGSLEPVRNRLATALGAEREFGAETGLTVSQLAPGRYHYMTGMPYFHNVDRHVRHASQRDAVSAVESGLSAGVGGTKKVYRIDLPGGRSSVFGVAIDRGDGVGRGRKDTDRELMGVVDWKSPRATAYLPVEILVEDGEVLSLRGPYRIALHFPDTGMKGAHGFMEVIKSSEGIKKSLAQVAKGLTPKPSGEQVSIREAPGRP